MESRSPARRIPVPTRRFGYAVVATLALAALPTLASELSAFWDAALVCLGGAILLDALGRPPPGTVEVDRILQGPSHVGRKLRYRIVLSSRADVPLEVSLRDSLPAPFDPQESYHQCRIAPGGREEVEFEVLCLDRGVYRFAPPTLRVSRRHGLLAFQETVGPTREVRVQPGRPAGETEAILTRADLLERFGERPVKVRGQDREFESIREYVPGDSIRFVDWKATARRHRPQIRQYQIERNADLIFALDCGRLMGSLIHGMRKLDLAMIPLLDLTAVALKRQDRVGLLAFDSRIRAYVPPRGGLSQLGHMMETLAGLDAPFEETSYTRGMLHLDARHRKRSLVVLFTDFTDEISARELHGTMAALCKRHALIFVAVSDPHLREIFQRPAPQERGVYQQAVAAELLAERRKVLGEATRLGAYAVEADPMALSAPLIARYVEVRYRVAL